MTEIKTNPPPPIQTTDASRQLYRTDRRTFWVSVVGSIVASFLFALFFQPIVTAISNVTVSTIGVFYTGYVDRLYYDAVQNPADQLIYMVFAIIGGLPLVILIATALTASMRRTEGQTRRRIARMLNIVLPFMMIALLILVAGPEVSVKPNATFQRRLLALTPVITEDERKIVLGEWAMVDSKEGYLRINTRLEELATKYHTTLPRK
jgi:hypothetical protein